MAGVMARLRPRSRAIVAALALTGATAVALDVGGCKREVPQGTGGEPTGSIQADSDAHPPVASASAPSAETDAAVHAPAAPPAACAVAFGGWQGGPAPGDDLSNAAVPLRVPEGASLTIAVRGTGHHVRVKGPAAVRPCTHDDPDVVLVASGEAATDAQAPIRPGAELFLATPAFVAVVGKAAVRVVASPTGVSSWEVDDGEATITNLDTTKNAAAKDRGALKRFELPGILLTRCGVQAASAAAAERMLLGMVATDAAPPLPSASIGILTAQQIKHARERVLDCAFAQVVGVACDLAAEGADAAPGCASHGYQKVREHVARSVASAAIPPGSPPPPPLIDAGK